MGQGFEMVLLGYSLFPKNLVFLDKIYSTYACIYSIDTFL